MRHSVNSLRFANETFHYIGSATLYLDIPAGVGTIAVDLDVVLADIPPILGLDRLDRERFTPDVSFNVLAKRKREQTTNGMTIYTKSRYLSHTPAIVCVPRKNL